MNKDELKQELAELHVHLDQVAAEHTTLDPATLESLRRVASDIQEILTEHANSPEKAAAALSKSPEASELPSTLEALAEQFSVEYPQTAAMLNRIGYLLGNMGI